MTRSNPEQDRLITRLLRHVEDLRAQVSRLLRDVANSRIAALKINYNYLGSFLANVLTNGGLISKASGTVTNVPAGTTTHPLISNGAAAPAFGLLQGAGLGANQVSGAGTLGGGAIHIEENTIDTADMAPLAITGAELEADAVTGAKIADNAVDSEHYVDGSVDAVHLAESYYQESEHFDTFQGTSAYPVKTKAATGKLDPTLVPPVENIAADAVDSDAILDGAVTAAKQEDITTSRIIGRTTAGSGEREQLTPAQARSVMSVTATANLGGDSIVLGLRRSGTWTAGQRIQGWTDTTDGFCRLRIPSGTTFEVTMVGCHIQNGNRSGTYSYRAGVTEYADDASTGSATARYAVASLEWSDTTVSGHYFGYKRWDGVTALASVTGGAAISILPFLENESSSPATTTSDNCHVIVVGRFV